MKKSHVTRVAFCLLVSFSFKAAAAADDAKVPEKLQGTWQVVKGERAGEEMPPEFAKQLKLEFTKVGLLLHKGEENTEFELKFTKEEKPGAFTMTAKEGNYQGKPGRALYEIDDDGNLKMCVPNTPDSEDDDPIKDFETGSKSQRHIVLTLKKA